MTPSAVVAFPGHMPDFRAARDRCAHACARYNSLGKDTPPELRTAAWNSITTAVLGPLPTNNQDTGIDTAPATPVDGPQTSPWSISEPTQAPEVKAPVLIDYGVRLYIHPTVFINYNCIILDTPVVDLCIGAETMIGPNCTLVTVSHSIDPDVRSLAMKGLCRTKHSTGSAITIGARVWLGSNVTVLPGVTIGDGCVIGAGSVVTKSIDAGWLAFGNPAKPVRLVHGYDKTPDWEVFTLEQALGFKGHVI